jgi:hypothetical protein
MAIAGTQKDGLDEVIWQKRKWRNNSSSLISFLNNLKSDFSSDISYSLKAGALLHIKNRH